MDGDAPPQQEGGDRSPEQERDDRMHVRQRFQKVVLEKPDGRLRPIRLNGVRHGHLRERDVNFSRTGPKAPRAPGRATRRRGAAGSRQASSQPLKIAVEEAGQERNVRPQRFAHDVRHRRRQRGRRRGDLVPSRHPLDQARAFRSVRVVLAGALLERLHHLAAAHGGHEQHPLQPPIPVHAAFVPRLEARLAVVVDAEEIERVAVDAARDRR